jgi:hypothetical protein
LTAWLCSSCWSDSVVARRRTGPSISVRTSTLPVGYHLLRCRGGRPVPRRSAASVHDWLVPATPAVPYSKVVPRSTRHPAFSNSKVLARAADGRTCASCLVRRTINSICRHRTSE